MAAAGMPRPGGGGKEGGGAMGPLQVSDAQARLKSAYIVSFIVVGSHFCRQLMAYRCIPSRTCMHVLIVSAGCVTLAPQTPAVHPATNSGVGRAFQRICALQTCTRTQESKSLLNTSET